MIFENKATLTYSGGRAASNSVSGQLLGMVGMTKSSANASYAYGSTVYYSVTITNTSDTPYTALRLTDDLGRYLKNGLGRFPLVYEYGSAALRIITQTGVTAGTVNADYSLEGMIFTFDLPAMATVILTYSADVTTYASPEAGAVITNNALLTGTGLSPSVSAAYTLPAETGADVRLSKSVCGVFAEGEQVTIRLTAANYGNTATAPDDYLVISDRIEPYLTGVTVSADGDVWQPGVQYTYDTATGLFQTVYGAFSLSAADYSRAPDGSWSTLPSSLTIVITGTVAAGGAPQALVSILPAYTDDREASLSVQRLANDRFLLGGDGAVPPAFSVLIAPDSRISMATGSDARYTLGDGGLLTIDTSGLVGTATARINVAYGGGFPVRLDYSQI